MPGFMTRFLADSRFLSAACTFRSKPLPSFRSLRRHASVLNSLSLSLCRSNSKMRRYLLCVCLVVIVYLHRRSKAQVVLVLFSLMALKLLHGFEGGRAPAEIVGADKVSCLAFVAFNCVYSQKR